MSPFVHWAIAHGIPYLPGRYYRFALIAREMMTFNVVKDAVKQYMDTHDGQLPPGLSISHFSRLNIKRS